VVASSAFALPRMDRRRERFQELRQEFVRLGSKDLVEDKVELWVPIGSNLKSSPKNDDDET